MLWIALWLGIALADNPVLQVSAPSLVVDLSDGPLGYTATVAELADVDATIFCPRLLLRRTMADGAKVDVLAPQAPAGCVAPITVTKANEQSFYWSLRDVKPGSYTGQIEVRQSDGTAHTAEFRLVGKDGRWWVPALLIVVGVVVAVVLRWWYQTGRGQRVRDQWRATVWQKSRKLGENHWAYREARKALIALGEESGDAFQEELSRLSGRLDRVLRFRSLLRLEDILGWDSLPEEQRKNFKKDAQTLINEASLLGLKGFDDGSSSLTAAENLAIKVRSAIKEKSGLDSKLLQENPPLPPEELDLTALRRQLQVGDRVAQAIVLSVVSLVAFQQLYLDEVAWSLETHGIATLLWAFGYQAGGSFTFTKLFEELRKDGFVPSA